MFNKKDVKENEFTQVKKKVEPEKKVEEKTEKKDDPKVVNKCGACKMKLGSRVCKSCIIFKEAK